MNIQSTDLNREKTRSFALDGKGLLAVLQVIMVAELAISVAVIYRVILSFPPNVQSAGLGLCSVICTFWVFRFGRHQLLAWKAWRRLDTERKNLILIKTVIMFPLLCLAAKYAFPFSEWILNALFPTLFKTL